MEQRPGGGLIFVGGPIHTMGSPAAAEAVRVDGRRITAAGGLEELRSLGDADVVDLNGRCLMPGFVDAHTHPLMHGQCTSWADLSGAASVDEVVKLLREHGRGLGAAAGIRGLGAAGRGLGAAAGIRGLGAAGRGLGAAAGIRGLGAAGRGLGAAIRGLGAAAAIRGFGYDQHRLAEDRHPTAADLDRVAADRAVVIMHASGHGYVANSHALAEAGITAATPTPPGGLIDRDVSGNPLGRVFDSACDLLTGPSGVKIANHGPNFHLPDEPDALDARLDEAQEALLAAGITTVGDCQVTDREMTNYLRARDGGRLRIRVGMYVLSSHVDGLRRLGVSSTLGNERLAIAGVKHYADGSLISGTAYLPCGCGATHGYLYHGEGELEDLLAESSTAGLQTATHAQGPDAIESALRGLERAPRPDLRHRIEHCGFPTDDQIERMARLGVVPVPQPTQVYRYGDGVRRDHPALAERMYASGMFRDAGLPVVLSSDAPVTAPDVPMACWSAETRLTSSGHVLGAGARLTRREAFEGYTTGGALALRRTDVGAIGPGMLADFAILDGDPLAVATDRLPDVAVDQTWVAGRKAWPSDGTAAC